VFRTSRLAFALLLALPATAAIATDDAPRPEVHPLDAITVTASRQATPLLEVPASVTLIDRDAIDRNIVTSLRELFRYEPGLAVNRDSRGREGEVNLSVRGLDGQRVLLLQDGVRLNDGIGIAGVTQGRGQLDVYSVSGVEVLKGPASGLYGSDALGGVVAFHTLSPADVLADPSRQVAGRVNLGYDSSDSSRVANAALAFRAGDSETLLNVTRRQGHELENHGGPVKPNPQDTDTRSALLKSVYHLTANQTLTATGDLYERRADTDQRSLLGAIAGGIRLTDSQARDRSKRTHGGLAWAWSREAAWLDHASAQVDYQMSRVTEHTYESRLLADATPRQRFGTVAERTPQWSSTVQAGGTVEAAALVQRWTVGVDYVRKNLSQWNDGLQSDPRGIVAPSKAYDNVVYPQKTAPDTRSTTVGVFAQDELAFLDGKLKITPGARFDSYHLTPEPDAAYANANVRGIRPASLDDHRVTPHLGATWEWAPGQVLYGSYMTGFRVPTSDQLNRVGQVPVATFVHDFIPAPDLKPEKSHGFELGLRGQGEVFAYDVDGFYSRYTDFIDTELVAYIPAGVQGPRAIRRFQSRNIDRVRIYGAEAKGQWRLAPALGLRDELTLHLAGYWSRGDNQTDDQPLDSVMPPRAVLGLSWDDAAGRYGGNVNGTWVGAKNRVDRSPVSGSTVFVPMTTKAYETLDLLGYVAFGPNVRLNLGVFNLFDRKYFEWPDVASRSATDAQLQSYTAPGRTWSANLRVSF
jgi:hemoglobin/transferrin/lactoferrin receptor protein